MDNIKIQIMNAKSAIIDAKLAQAILLAPHVFQTIIYFLDHAHNALTENFL